MKKILLSIALLLGCVFSGFSQTDGKTIIKLSALDLIYGNFGVSGERIINNRISVQLGINYMPSRGIPFLKDTVTQQGVGGTVDMKISSFSLTPEVRIYTGSGYGKGFYIAPYLKYQQYGAKNISVQFQGNDNVEREVILDGKINTYSGGVLLGYQWLVGRNKNIVIDYSILGFHAGIMSGNIHGLYAKGEMTPNQQAEVKSEIEKTLDGVPVINIKREVTVDSKNANVKIQSPWAFPRMGLSIGYRF